ncbi:MAG: dTMP kinase [Dehalococcoidia bacterium]
MDAVETNGPGWFIVFEGDDGAGKSTISAAIARRLAEEGLTVLLTREPGGTPAGEQVRQLLRERLTPWAEVFAFLLARAELVETVVRPALERGATVICDRFEGSTFAYQGYARGLDLKALRAANHIATGGLSPHLNILLDLDPRVALERKRGEDGPIATGLEDLAFHERVREGYHALAHSHPGRWVMIDASRPLAEVEQDAWDAVHRLVNASR